VRATTLDAVGICCHTRPNRRERLLGAGVTVDDVVGAVATVVGGWVAGAGVAVVLDDVAVVVVRAALGCDSALCRAGGDEHAAARTPTPTTRATVRTRERREIMSSSSRDLPGRGRVLCHLVASPCSAPGEMLGVTGRW
jgi:hypothetical protein